MLYLGIGETFAGHSVSTPVVVLRGVRTGPTLCLTAGIHGDEINGVEIVRRALDEMDPKDLAGTIIGVPMANMHGFRRSSRYLPDRRDLNRHFPGNPNGSSASRIAHQLFERVIRKCGLLVDFHTGSFHRRNLPQVRADLSRPEVYSFAIGFGSKTVVHNLGTPGVLRRAAVDAGVPALTYEAGEPMELREQEVRRGVEGVRNLLANQGMSKEKPRAIRGQQIFYNWHWVRANDGGIFLATAKLGDHVQAGQVLGHVTDPISNESTEVVTPYAGTVLGMAVNQVVMPGFAAFYVGVDTNQPATFPIQGAEPDDALDEPFEIDARPE
ncbi:MAG: succinylglutamate desuccinylase/aspartoacylase family protein [Deltaproteobacteria bacterium]|nr:succinylglutamate desuccinylase/aspartoacylase family protein [Deltaproteobacteria bacterium]